MTHLLDLWQQAAAVCGNTSCSAAQSVRQQQGMPASCVLLK
jgi:hypothetical protein